MASMSAPRPTMKSGKLGTRLEMSSSLCTLAADASSMVTLYCEMIPKAKIRDTFDSGPKKTPSFFSPLFLSNLKGTNDEQ